MSEKSVHNSIVAFAFLFVERKYPTGSIVFGVGGDEHFVPDATIVNPETGLELAYLEVKESPTKSALDELAQRYTALRRRKDTTTPVFLISTSVANEYEPRIFTFSSENQWLAIRKEDFPSFETLSSRSTVEQAALPAKKAVSTAGRFKVVSQCFAWFLLLLLLLDFLGCIQISQEHLLLLLGAAVMFVLPYFSIIKAVGLEFQREKEAEQKTHNVSVNTDR